MNYTKSKWKYFNGVIYPVDSGYGSRSIATIDCIRNPNTYKQEWEENAKLISFVPEMYEAIKLILKNDKDLNAIKNLLKRIEK